MKHLILGLLCLLLTAPCWARTITVDDDGLADFNNIQAAIEDANDGDEVVVEDGNYTGDGNRDIDFLGKAITVRSQNGPTNCIIDCNGSASEPHRGFVFYSGEGPNSVLSGFTIRNGWGALGGAIFCDDSSPSIEKCLIIDNVARDYGGGILLWPGSESNLPNIRNCIVADNLSMYNGGGIDLSTWEGVLISGCTIVGNVANHVGGGIHLTGDTNDVYVKDSILWGNSSGSWGDMIYATPGKGGTTFSQIDFSILQSDWHGHSNIIADPCFADPCSGDYHLKSQAGRWDPNTASWVKDTVTSLAIDAGNPGCPLGDEPNDANNVRINLGAYGGTGKASKTPANWRSIADLTNDWLVDYKDLSIFVDYWLEAGQCIPSDLNRSQSVNLEDFSIFAHEWAEAYLGEPAMTYQIGDCSSQALGLSAAGLSEQTRFTATVDGRYIHFEDTMVANCCPDELGLEMTVEGDLITIYETELITSPCRCICDYPVSAILGPFAPGTYTLEVYEDWGGFIGSTTVTIN